MTLEQISRHIALAVQKERQRCVRIVTAEADYRAGCGAFDTAALLAALVERIDEGNSASNSSLSDVPTPASNIDDLSEDMEELEEATRVLSAARQARAHRAGYTGFLRD